MDSFFGKNIPSVVQAVAPPPPVVTPPPVMPVPDDERTKERKKLANERGAAARGRQSTVLSNDVGNTDHLGG